MTIYGQISDYKKARFKAKFGEYFTLNPDGTEWMAIDEAIYYVLYRAAFKQSFSLSEMVLMLRENCLAAGLTRENRGEPPHVLEGYVGIERKA